MDLIIDNYFVLLYAKKKKTELYDTTFEIYFVADPMDFRCQ